MLQSLLPRKKLCYKKGGFERSITAPCSSGAWTVEERLRNDCTIHSPTRSNCHPVPYCSNRCQEQHWHQHRRDCVKVNEFKLWIAEKAPLAQVGAFADSVCFNCGAVRGPVLHFGGVHGRWPSVLNTDAAMSKCSQCKHAHYCSKECQVTHWKAGHKAECSPATK